METTIQATSALAGVNILLLLALTAVWVNNYRTFRTPLVLGLVAFGAAMLAENALALYFLFTMQSLYSGDPHVQQAVLALRALQLLALGFLAYVTLQ
jgi:multisubunit Na+/H+ antiporter MnhF subunit